MSNGNLSIALLLGGTSPEREVSKESGKAIAQALRELEYKVTLIDPAYGLDQPENEEDFFSPNDKISNDKTLLRNDSYLEIVNSSVFDNVDLVFLGLHGKWGEDGNIQALLELRGIKYTGAKLLSSALAMNKIMSKIMFQHFDVATPEWFIVEKKKKEISLVKNKIKKSIGYPAVIKPNDEGSTFGLTICRGEDELEKAVDFAFEYSDKVLVEKYIAGREMTVGILNQQVLPVLEIIPKHGLYDYEAKYTDGMSEYIVPADIPEDVAKHMRQQALLAYNAVECSNYGRVDFRLSDQNKSYCLEVNTLPGMTSHSLIPKMAKAVGISFNELIDRIVKFELNG